MDKIQNIQKKIGKMTKDTQGYNYKYFDINQLLEKLTPLLHEEGLTLIQPLTNIEGKPAIRTMIYEIYEGKLPNNISEKGAFSVLIDYAFPLPELTKPQEMGSAITYYRRYSLQSLFALEAEDDDGAKTEPKLTKKEFNQKNKQDKENNVDPLEDDVI